MAKLIKRSVRRTVSRSIDAVCTVADCAVDIVLDSVDDGAKIAKGVAATSRASVSVVSNSVSLGINALLGVNLTPEEMTHDNIRKVLAHNFGMQDLPTLEQWEAERAKEAAEKAAKKEAK